MYEIHTSRSQLPEQGVEQAQIQRVGVAGVAAVASQEPDQCQLLGFPHRRLVDGTVMDMTGTSCGHGRTSPTTTAAGSTRR
jgi:hypothetical protein